MTDIVGTIQRELLSVVLTQLSAECIYSKRWKQRPVSSSQRQSGASAISNGDVPGVSRKALSNEDDAKLIFGTVFSLRRMVRQLGGEDDRYDDRFVLLWQ